MRTKLIAAAAVMGLVALVLVGGVFGGGASGAPTGTTLTPNCTLVNTDEVGVAVSIPGSCATLEVTKVVTGAVPAGTTFPVQVVCGVQSNEVGAEGLPPVDELPVNKTLPFLEGGGTESVFLFFEGATVCTISETPPPGCTLVSIDPATVPVNDTAVDSGTVFTVTVTNDCEVPPAPAAAVAAVPTFTG